MEIKETTSNDLICKWGNGSPQRQKGPSGHPPEVSDQNLELPNARGVYFLLHDAQENTTFKGHKHTCPCSQGLLNKRPVLGSLRCVYTESLKRGWSSATTKTRDLRKPQLALCLLELALLLFIYPIYLSLWLLGFFKFHIPDPQALRWCWTCPRGSKITLIMLIIIVKMIAYLMVP